MYFKAQAGIVFVIVLLLLGLATYAFIIHSNNDTGGNELLLSDYIQDYASSMLTSLLRSSTGNPLAGCETVKDVLAKAYYAPSNGKCCGISEYTCREYAQLIVEDKINKLINNAKKNYVYYFEFGKKLSSSPLLFAYPSQNAFIKNCKCEKIIVEQKLIDAVKETTSYPYARVYVVRLDEIPGDVEPVTSSSETNHDNIEHLHSSTSASQNTIASDSFTRSNLISSLRSCLSDDDCNSNEKCCISASCGYFPHFTGKCLNSKVYDVISHAESMDTGDDGRALKTDLTSGEYKVFLYYSEVSCLNPLLENIDLQVHIGIPSCHSFMDMGKIIMYAGENCEYLPTSKEEVEAYLDLYKRYAVKYRRLELRESQYWCNDDLFCAFDNSLTNNYDVRFNNYARHPLKGCYVVILWNYLKPEVNDRGLYFKTYLASDITGLCFKCLSGLRCYGHIDLAANSPCTEESHLFKELRSLRGVYTPQD